jgi:hypothetical protein
MAGGSVTVAALRHRPRQALLIVALSAVITAAAGLGALYARAVEQSVLQNVIAAAPLEQSRITVSATGDRPPSPGRLARAVAAETPRQFGAGIPGADAPVQVTSRPGSGDGAAARSRLVSRDGLCRHLTVADGRCVAAVGEVLVSRRAATTLGVGPGDALRVQPESAGTPDTGEPARSVTLDARVVGIYQALPQADRFWAGVGRSAVQAARPGAASLAAVDDVLTGWPTLAASPWPDLSTHVDIPLALDRVDLAGIPAVQRATTRVDRQAATLDAAATSQLGALLESSRSQREQARSIIPLLSVQLAVLGVVVLAFVCAAATEQRRPEIALARLRGLGTAGAAGLLVRELGALVIAGGVVGTALGWLAALGATSLWLQPGVALEARWPVTAAVVAAVTAGLLAIAAAGAPTLRQPLTALLRRVPPRATTLQVGIAEGAVVAAAGAGLVTLLSGEGGPVALLAPGLLAIAGGLLLAQAVMPAAALLARLSLSRGRVSSALAGVQIARRPALRRLIAIVTVACALLVFAVDAWTVSDRNRTTHAAVDAGAPVVLTVDADSSLELRRAVLEIDPEGGFATPVVTIRSAAETGPRTTAVEPEAFRRVARWGTDANRPTAAELRALDATVADSVALRGSRVELTAAFAARGLPPAEGAPVPDLAPMRLEIGVVDPDGVLRRVDLGRLDDGRGTYRGEIPCPDGCLLRQVTVNRTFGDFADAQVELEVRSLRAGAPGALADVDLDSGTEGSWLPTPWRAVVPADGAVQPGPTLRFFDVSYGVPVTVQRGDVLVNPPALVAGRVTRLADNPNVATSRVVAADLTTGDRAYDVAGRLPQVPRSGPRGVLVDLEAVLAGPSAAPAQTSYDVWLAADDPTREARLRAELAQRGLAVTARDSAAAHEDALAAEGPTLALRLAILAGVVALLLAATALVVGVATSGESRARDLAGLRLAGVPAATVRSAAVREHVVIAALGVLAGAVLGVVAARAALPRIPLFATPPTRLPLVLDPVWPAVGATVAVCLLLLSAVSVLVGRALAAAATPALLRAGR